MIRPASIALSWAVLGAGALGAPQDEARLEASRFSGLAPREIGPAMCSGRIIDFAVDPEQHSRYFVATAAGGVWRTENSGITWTPVFDGEGSYSIGCVTMDPGNRNVIWVGSGENNSQRSVSFGDGVYRSRDGGQSWENVGLRDSEHIGRIVVDPRDGDRVFVAAQGPLWREGGDRGLYRTVDGGESWERVLYVDEHTGANEVWMDPRDPDTLYCSTYQRRRHVWTLINGGPGSGLYKSTDGGRHWREIERGLPSVDLGRIGLCVSPADPDVVYAIVEAAQGEGGVFRSVDRGESWDKQSDKVSSSPQYYNELVGDPWDPNIVYCLDTWTTISVDGGQSWTNLGNEHRHVDDHALWIDPDDTAHLLIGGDGGVFESFDRGSHWDFKENLPLGQFYRVSADQARPFYNVYGGTQDNNSMGGPSRTTRLGGITNDDWFVTVGGDGYEAQVDPEDPNIVYSQWQYGGLMRLDRRSGELVDIKPREEPGAPPLKWNWDSPLQLSHHSRTRLYFAANVLFRSDDRGDTWTAISGDLTRGIDRDQLEVMGRVWEVDAVAKNRSTSLYGNAVSFSESAMNEELLYVGTDDGLIHVSTDGGASWRKIESFPGVPERSYVSRLEASRHVEGRVYAAFDNHKMGDFRPYLLVSEDHGQTWRSVAGDLPERDVVYALAEDHEDPELLFCGTEFGASFSVDGGQHWLRIGGGFPTIAVRDIELQRREDDLILGTFGRGIWILDDYSALREVSAEVLSAPAHLFAVRTAPLYVPGSRLGLNTGLGTQGATYYAAENPPYGALISYSLGEKITTRRERRREAQKEARAAGETAPYPTVEQLRAEDREEDPQVFLTIRDADGSLVRRVPGSREAGVHRVNWDLREPPSIRTYVGATPPSSPWSNPDAGPLVLPGRYSATLDLERDGGIERLAGPVEFAVESLNLQTLPAPDRAEVLAFQRQVADLRRAVRAAGSWAGEAGDRIVRARKAVMESRWEQTDLLKRLHDLEEELDDASIALNGDGTLFGRSMPAPLSISARVENVAGQQFYTTAAPTTTEREALAAASEGFAPVLESLRGLDAGLREIEALLGAAGAPWTPGRLPDWKPASR